MRNRVLAVAGAVVVAGFFAAALTAESGLDYEIDAQRPIDALARAVERERRDR